MRNKWQIKKLYFCFKQAECMVRMRRKCAENSVRLRFIENIISPYINHFPCFLSLRLRNNDDIEQPNKLIKLRVNSNEAYEAFLADLQTCDFTALLDHGDPNQNYDKLHQKLSELKCKHLPWKIVKFNKYRHKNNRWITHGVIKSIKYRDKLYRNLKNASKDSISYDELKNRLSVYNKILKKTIREARYIYYNRQFEESKTNVRKTWSTINEIISRTKNKKMALNLS